MLKTGKESNKYRKIFLKTAPQFTSRPKNHSKTERFSFCRNCRNINMNPMRVRIIVAVGVFLVIVAGALSYALHKGFIRVTLKKEEVVVSGQGLITYRDTGFSPGFLMVKKGTKITFLNSSKNALWPASDLHPTHARYPGSSINLCGTTEESLIFDSCHDIPPGSLWSFTFNEIDVWGYHNHLQAGHLGTIRVVE